MKSRKKSRVSSNTTPPAQCNQHQEGAFLSVANGQCLECEISWTSKIFLKIPFLFQMLLISLGVVIVAFVSIRFRPEEVLNQVKGKAMKLFMSMVLRVSAKAFSYLEGTTVTEEEEEGGGKSAADLAREERENKKKTQALIRNVRVKAKVLMTMMQLLGQFPAIFTTIAFPKVYLDITVSFGALVNFDLFTAMPFSCFYPSFNFYDDLLSSTVGPLIVMFVLFCVAIALSWRVRGDAEATLEIRDRTAGILLLVSYLVFSSVSTKLFQVRSQSIHFHQTPK